jgi:hypothetical protein
MAAEGALSDEDIDFILNGILRKVQRKGRAFDKQAVIEAATEMGREQIIARALERRLKVASEKASQLFDSHIDGMAGVGDVGDRLRAYLVGSEKQGLGASFSVEAEGRALQAAYLGEVERGLRAAGLVDRVTAIRVDRQFELNVAREMGRANGGPDLPTGDADAMKVAEIFNAANERARLSMNDQGAWIGKLEGFITRQTHDAQKVAGGFFKEAAAKKAGTSVERRAFGKWRDTIRPLLDERTFDGIDASIADDLNPDAKLRINDALSDPSDPVEQFLFDIWWNITQGKADVMRGADDMADFRPPASKARSVSRSRVLHFRDAESWTAYNDAFGSGSLFSSQMAGLSRAALNTAIMRRLGPAPEAMFQNKKAALLAEARAIGDSKAATKISEKKRDHEFEEITGSLSAPQNLRLAQVGRAIRIQQALAKLGGMALSSMSDTALASQTMKRAGSTFLDGYRAAFGGILRLGPQEAKEAADLLDVASRAMAASIAGRFMATDGMNGIMGGLQRTFYKVNAFEFIQTGVREGVAQATSRMIAQQADRPYAALNAGFRETLERYGIDAAAWELGRSGHLNPHKASPGYQGLRQRADENMAGDEPGRRYWTFEALDGISDKDLLKWAGDASGGADAARRARGDLKVKYQAMVQGILDDALTEPRARERVGLTAGQRPGTFWGETVRIITQFQSFNRAIIGRHLMPASRGYAGQGRVSLLAHLIVATTLLGYLQIQAKQIAAGREPRGFTDEDGEFQGGKLFAASLLAGGGLGIYGDFLFGETNRQGLGFTVGSLFGPTVSEVERFITIGGKAFSGDPDQTEDIPSDLVRGAKANIPFVNLFYTRAALDYAVWFQLQEATKPGSVEKYERRVEKEQNTRFFFSPAEAVD